MRFANRTIVITGAAGGIGLACAGLFLDEGANVVLADIDEEALQAVIAAIPEVFSKRAIPVVCDVTNARQVEALITHAAAKFGAFDALVAGAGTILRKPFSDLHEKEFEGIVHTNLKGTFLCVQAAAKMMLEQQDHGREILGSIVTFSSDPAFEAIPHIVPYAVASGGIERMTTSLARGFASAGIRINTIAAGMVDTKLLRAATGTGKTAINAGMGRMTQSRLQDADEIAKLAAFLISTEASAITGQILGTGAN